MAELYAFDKRKNVAISGATVWDYSVVSAPVLVGATNGGGILLTDGPLPQRMRVIASGYIPIDLIFGSQRPLRLGFEKLHTGAYSGYLPSEGMATWSREGGRDLRQFTAAGLYRQAGTEAELQRAEYFQYKMLETEGWAGLLTRSQNFPTTTTAWTGSLNGFSFRFPEAGVMLARSVQDHSLAKFVRIN